jgi:hypothetical protein
MALETVFPQLAQFHVHVDSLQEVEPAFQLIHKILQLQLAVLLDNKLMDMEIVFLFQFQLFVILDSTATEVDHAFQIQFLYLLYVHQDIQAMEMELVSLLIQL